MDVAQLYWILEYAKVLLAYGFVMYVWPLVVFEGHLKDKSRTYRFSFCTTTSILIINTGVLLLGFFHILYPALVGVLYFGVFFFRLFRAHNPGLGWVWDVRKRLAGTMSLRRLLLRWFTAAADGLRNALSSWWRSTRGKRLEYFLLLVAVLFGMLYFSYGAFDEHSYGFGDQYVHHAWTYGLKQGLIFYDGIYPEAMHCVIYMACVMFRIRLYSGVLFFAGIHVPAFLVACYLFMKELFHWRYTALAVLFMFLTFDQLCVNEVYGMSRLSWTLPLEFGLFTQVLSALYLLRFLKRVMGEGGVLIHWTKPKEWLKLLQDGDLLLFMTSVAASLAIHFYVTIIAIFFCAAVGLVYLRQLLHRGSLVPLMVSAILALVIAVAPMAMAFAAGYPLQGSIGWAVNVINGTDPETFGEGAPATPTPVPETPVPTAASVGQAGEAPTAQTGNGASSTPAGTGTTSQPQQPAQPEIPLSERLRALALKVWEKLQWAGMRLYTDGYNTLYPGVRGQIAVAATAGVFLVCGLLRLLLTLMVGIRYRRERRTLKKRPPVPAGEGEPAAPEKRASETPRRGRTDYFHGYLIVALLSVILMVMYAPTGFGLPSLVAGSRLCSTEQMVLLMVYGVPIDLCFVILRKIVPDLPLQGLSYALCAGIYVFTQTMGIFHGYLYYELTRYDAAVEVTNRIVASLPAQTYTVVSTTDEFYQLVETGFHEELLTFLQRERDPTYTIPTPYVFLYVEKRPIHYAQKHFASGPRWLAEEKYYPMYESLNSASQCPGIRGGEISGDMADQDIRYGLKLSDTASDLDGRIILESKAYRWFQTFSEMYPYEGRVLYEDDDFLCYGFEQNVNCLYSLGIFAES